MKRKQKDFLQVIYDDVLEYRGFINSPSRCYVKITQGHRRTCVMIIQRTLNDGTSITNAAEIIASLIVQRFHLKPRQCLFVEHYAPGVLGYPFDVTGEGCHKLVEFSWSWHVAGWSWHRVASDPKWKRSSAGEVDTLLARL